MSPRWTTELVVGIGAWDLSVQLRPRLPGGRRVATKSYALHPPQDSAEVGKAATYAERWSDHAPLTVRFD